MFCVIGCEDQVIEYAVTDTQYTKLRSIDVRKPFVIHGVPVVHSYPVSLVRYSPGGGMQAVVTGMLMIVVLFIVYAVYHCIAIYVAVILCQ